MLTVITECGVSLFGNDGNYKILGKEGELIKYEFTPYGSNNSILEKKTLRELSDRVGFRLIWGAWDD